MKTTYEQRVDFFYETEFFVSRTGLAEAIAKVESKTGIRIPNSFKHTPMPEYEFGSLKMRMGKIDRYFYFGMSNDGSLWQYEAFESKNALKLFFTRETIDADLLAFWLREIDEIPNRL